MNDRISVLQQRGFRPTDALRLEEAEAGSLVLPCLLSLMRGTDPSETLPATGGAILFRADSSELIGPARTALHEWSATLRRDPALRVLIGGFTSQIDFTADAMGLALRRVEAIRAYLGSRGIAANRIDVAVSGAGWFVVERTQGGFEGDSSGRCLLEIVDPQWAWSRN